MSIPRETNRSSTFDMLGSARMGPLERFSTHGSTRTVHYSAWLVILQINVTPFVLCGGE